MRATPAAIPRGPSERLAVPAVTGARVSVYTTIGAAAGFVPLPWVPEVMVSRVRGAILEDICQRAGLTVSREARSELTRPGGGLPAARGVAGQAAEFLTRRVLGRLLRLGPLAIYAPLRSGLDTYVFARLFERYARQRPMGIGPTPHRIDEPEARRLRRALDGALAKALTVGRVPSGDIPPRVADDDRDPLTATIDRALMGVAAVPEWLLGHLDAAFDALLEGKG